MLSRVSAPVQRQIGMQRHHPDAQQSSSLGTWCNLHIKHMAGRLLDTHEFLQALNVALKSRTFIQPEVLPRGARHQVASPAAHRHRASASNDDRGAQRSPCTTYTWVQRKIECSDCWGAEKLDGGQPVRNLVTDDAVQAAVAGQERWRHVRAARVLLRTAERSPTSYEVIAHK